MKRYDLITNYRAGSSIEEMEPSDDGEWVRFEDAVGIIAGYEQRMALINSWSEKARDIRSVPCAAPVGSTAEQPPGVVTDAKRPEKCRTCNGSGFVAYWDGSAYAGEGCPDC